MFSQIPEKLMHIIRWILVIVWLLIISSLFYDPWSPHFTESNHPWSLLRLTSSYVYIQNKYLIEKPYSLSTTLLWGAILPCIIFLLLVLGHEWWRRICPLSFLSQIPRALGWQRHVKRRSFNTGKIRYELAKVKSASWLGQNYSYLQFGLLFVGLCGRILFFNADRFILAGWLLFSCISAIFVGYLYGGKSWCHYFCPMSPVQRFYSLPSGLLASNSRKRKQLITESMCRVTLPDGKEQSACIACQSSCIDIDSERSYWDKLDQPEESFIRYGYVGLVVGYFLYYYLYAGNWEYYFSGVWLRELDQLSSLTSPGFYLFGQVINIPKIFAVPLTLGGFTIIGYGTGCWAERWAKENNRRRFSTQPFHIIKHRIFTLCTFGTFVFFFIFSGRPLIRLLPNWCQYIYEFVIITCSILWAYKTWQYCPGLYIKESKADRFE